MYVFMLGEIKNIMEMHIQHFETLGCKFLILE